MADAWREDWLALVDEPVIDPDRPIIDPHHHLWHGYGPVPNPYLAADLFADATSGHRIEQTVYVEAYGTHYRDHGPDELRPVGETEFAVAQAEELEALGGPTIGGIVSHADLLRGEDVEAVLDAHVVAGRGLFRGIRQGSAYDADSEIGSYGPPSGPCYTEPQFHRGMRVLARMGLTFDAWVYHTQIQDVTSLARACPDNVIVLDHYGAPLGIGPYAGRRDEVFALWRRGIDELAQQPNVHIKLGGYAEPRNGHGWHLGARPPGSEALAEVERPFFEVALEKFGAERCMLESNFPADKYAASYRVVWNARKRLAAAASEDEKDLLFGGTARRVYSLPEGTRS